MLNLKINIFLNETNGMNENIGQIEGRLCRMVCFVLIVLVFGRGHCPTTATKNGVDQ